MKVCAVDCYHRVYFSENPLSLLGTITCSSSCISSALHKHTQRSFIVLTIFYRFSCFTELKNRLVAAVDNLESYGSQMVLSGPIVCKLCVGRGKYMYKHIARSFMTNFMVFNDLRARLCVFLAYTIFK